MYNDDSSPTLINCTFSGNSAYAGGGICNHPISSPTLISCTFSGNSAYDEGGGLCNWEECEPTLSNCIVWGNTAPTEPQIYDYSSTTSAIFSCIQGGWLGTGNIEAEPLFMDADGPDDVPGTPDDNLRLQPGSPCIDAGLSVGIALDQDGNQRMVDDPATPDTGIGFPEVIDMGPYEYGSTPPWPGSADLDGDGDVDLADFGLFQQQFTGPQ